MKERISYDKEETVQMIEDAGEIPEDFFSWMIGQDATVGFDMKLHFRIRKIEYWLSQRKRGQVFPVIVSE